MPADVGGQQGDDHALAVRRSAYVDRRAVVFAVPSHVATVAAGSVLPDAARSGSDDLDRALAAIARRLSRGARPTSRP